MSAALSLHPARRNWLSPVHLFRHKQTLGLIGILASLLVALLVFNEFVADRIEVSKQQFDRVHLDQFFRSVGYDNDVVLDRFLIPAHRPHDRLINVQLLGLERDRYAYLAKQAGQVVAIAVPATADDGFNGTIDLLIAIDMYGRITAARVIEDLTSDALVGVVDVIDSTWMRQFTGNAMRDIKRLSWQTITAENEYDQFVGASITPKAVADRIYNAMVFFQSNRIVLMAGE